MPFGGFGKTQMLLVFPSVLLLCLCPGALCSSGQKLVVLPCDRPLFQSKLSMCLSEFNRSLEQHRFSQGCVWPDVKRTYSVLKLCVDTWARGHWCSGVGTLVDDFFKDVHLTYFSECGRIQDPPMTALVLMVAPLVISTLLLPILCVYLTTKKQE
ncbi:receptor activity-modifying protein 1-like [Periophthalmus magnuspinnatus]|uniref:receptor activity-modifying protein 1-like n=1 Tax=Periophthalmus magnuspinnatus TaxID=409849 RepID=UPI002437302E|nr:receptor activity-modifying protein 1-like [Periophthalmus magnuspinnatus]